MSEAEVMWFTGSDVDGGERTRFSSISYSKKGKNWKSSSHGYDHDDDDGDATAAVTRLRVPSNLLRLSAAKNQCFKHHSSCTQLHSALCNRCSWHGVVQSHARRRGCLIYQRLLLSSSSPLCRVFILIFLRQTMSLGNTVLQLFCCFYSWCLYR